MQPPFTPAERPDPLIGQVIADRYEVEALLKAGGMARLYRGVQRSLERSVVIKTIDPDLLSGDEATAEEATARFMVEARAASRLNHPNVVSIFDFGRTSAGPGGLLFMVMELLSGQDLWDVIGEQPRMPLPRIVDILRQTLAGLGEAHHLGITHRDVKPENIILENRRGRDHVKVIDFGVAKLASMQAVTKAGHAVGTPRYMAPTEVAGTAVGAADVYAVGILLFELLTGDVPFDGETPLQIIAKHIQAPRVDPRTVAPDRDIPEELALVCLQAIDRDPARRFATAEDLAAAILEACPPEEPAPLSVSSRGIRPSARFPTPPRISMQFDLPPAPGSSTPSTPPRPSAPPRSLAAPRLSLPALPRDEPAEVDALLGREAEMAWAEERLADPTAAACAVWGRPGVGRTRLLEEIARRAARAGLQVVQAPAPPRPLSQVGYGGLRRALSRLTGLAPTDPQLVSGEAADGAEASAGLRAVFAGEAPRAGAPGAARDAAAAALRWAVRRATSTGPVLLAVDDVHRYDGASRRALADLLAAEPPPGLKVVLTSEGDPADLGLPPTARRVIGGLPPGDVEPLFLALTRRWAVEGRAPTRLMQLVEWRVTQLPPAQRRALQAVALTGGGSVRALSKLWREGEDLGEPLRKLADLGFVRVVQGVAVLAHDLYGRIATALAPAGVIAEIHAAAAESLAGATDRAELRAFHGLRGTPDFEVFMITEEAAALRAARGDDEGAIAMLSDGMGAGRTLLQRGEDEAGASACLVFGRKLGEALLAVDGTDDADGVLRECIELTGPHDLGRALLLEQLARVSDRRSQQRAAAQQRKEALAIAQSCGDRELVLRLSAASRP